MGQGVHTALPMLVADELDLPLEWVSTETAGPQSIYGNVAMFVASLPFHPRSTQPGQETVAARTGQSLVGKLARELGLSVTGGSSSVADAWEPGRLAAATARAQLVAAAAQRWGAPAAEVQVRDGALQHGARRAHFGELAAAAVRIHPEHVRPKAPAQRKLVGQAAPRRDMRAKVTGQAVFGIDVRPPGLLFAAVRMAPMLGGGVGALRNEAEVLRMPGVQKCLRLGAHAGATAGVAVVAHTTWHALRAVQALDVQWQAPPNDQGQPRPPQALADSDRILQALVREAKEGDGGTTFHSRGDAGQAEAQARHQLEATYQAPYLAHGTMEPMNGTALLQDGRLTLWLPTQVPSQARKLAAKAAGVDEAHVALHVTLLGGGFGRRLEVDYVLQAVEAAKAMPGRPVQILWPREEDMTHDFYRPASAAHLRASWGADWGKAGARPQSLRVHSAGDAITPRWMARTLPALAGPMDMPDKTAMEGLFDQPYAIAHQHMRHAATRNEVPVGFWRSVGHSHHAFFIESFVDEMAVESKMDPVAFRLSLLADMPRHAAVLRLAADKAGWGGPLAAGRARGVALHESFGSIVAQVAEVSLDQGAPRVHRVVVAVDCGTVVNPGIVAQQMESGVIFGLTAALHGRIDVKGGVVQQKNFPDYPLLGLAQSPVIETHIVPSSLPPTGVGEPGTPPIAPAVANALFALTGKRLRALPLRLG
jgi:isoquinoline 1-oxidoreductase beta subunit